MRAHGAPQDLDNKLFSVALLVAARTANNEALLGELIRDATRDAGNFKYASVLSEFLMPIPSETRTHFLFADFTCNKPQALYEGDRQTVMIDMPPTEDVSRLAMQTYAEFVDDEVEIIEVIEG